MYDSVLRVLGIKSIHSFFGVGQPFHKSIMTIFVFNKKEREVGGKTFAQPHIVPVAFGNPAKRGGEKAGRIIDENIQPPPKRK